MWQRCAVRGLKLGISTHDHAELDRALSFDPDYVALGPIFPTLLKQMPWAPQGLARVGEWKRLAGERPLVAIGGLTLERIPGVLAAGADCVAVVTDIVRAPDPEARTREWMRATRAARSGSVQGLPQKALKAASPGAYPVPGQPGSWRMRTTIALDDELVATAQEFTGLKEKSALVREALKALIEREASRRMARLGGSEPGLKAPPRRRSAIR